MSEFEVLLVPVSLVLGLGITSILSAFVSALRNRRSTRLHWVPITWAVVILFFQIGYFNVLFDLGETGRIWSWTIYGTVLFQTGVLFLAGSLVLPDHAECSSDNLLADFEQDGRLALIPLAFLVGAGPLTNRIQFDSTWVNPGNVINVVLTVTLLAAYFTRSQTARSVLTVVAALTSAYGFFSAWSQPGVAN